MNRKPVIWAVGISCKPEDDEKFTTWYDEIHVPMLLRGDFVSRVARFRVADEAYHVGTTTQVAPTYLTIYEFDSRENLDAWLASPARQEAGADKAKTWGDNCYEVKLATRYDIASAWND